MKRRRFTQLGAATAAALATGVQNSSSAPAKRPNVLFIPVDDMNDWIGCLGGHPDARTPHMDRLASTGTLFTHAYCSAPICTPTRTSLLTGIRPSTSGVYHNNQLMRQALPDAMTLNKHFMDAGYHVMGGGKIFHYGGNVESETWHEWFGRPSWPVGPNPWAKPGETLRNRFNGLPYDSDDNAYINYFDWGGLDVDDDETGDGKLARWAVEKLQKPYDKPFFLAAGVWRPHTPMYAPKKYFDMFPPEDIHLPKILERDTDDLPPLGKRIAERGHEVVELMQEHGLTREAVAAYLACTAYADAQIGRILDALEASPYADNTIVMLWGDHGWHLGEKLHWRKFTLWEDGTHCPLIIRVPGMTQPGSVCEHPTSLLDLYPTLEDLCGLTENPALEGKTLRPWLDDADAPKERPAVTTYGCNNHSVRSAHWRYIRYSDGTEELYDRRTDPDEWTNIANDGQYDAVKKQLSLWLPKVNAPNAPMKNTTEAWIDF